MILNSTFHPRGADPTATASRRRRKKKKRRERAMQFRALTSVLYK